MSMPARQARSFNYRYVPYGTRFSGRTGPRAEGMEGDMPSALYENEVAVDVGGTCLPRDDDGRTLLVLDHHFPRADGSRPSAAATVLEQAERIVEQVGVLEQVWLVTHQDPDFDALCALYLARCLLDGTLDLHAVRAAVAPYCANERSWLSPAGNISAAQRWPVLLAAYASCVDEAAGVRCPRGRALHSVLYGLQQRAGAVLPEGGQTFFDDARRAIVKQERNPIFDALLEDNPRYDAVHDWLDGESAR